MAPCARIHSDSPRRLLPWKWGCFVVLGSLLGSGVCGAQDRGEGQGRRRFDPASFLQRLDRNGNKILEPDELQGRAQGFVANLGFDTASSIPIEAVMEKINRDRSSAEEEKKQNEAASKRDDAMRLVPDFGEEVALPGVLGFGDTGEKSGSSPSAKSLEEASETIRTQVERVLRQYDENKNGALDANEIQNASWGQPAPESSDLNHDGRLTQDELIARYQARERDSERMNSRDRDTAGDRPAENRRDRDRGEASADAGTRGRGGRTRDESSAGSRAAAPAPSPTGSSTSSGSSRSAGSRSASASEKIAGYVSNQLEKYDKDRNGSLSGEELNAMGNAPKNADQDGNGELSRQELEQYYGGGYRENTSGNAAKPAASSDKPPEKTEAKEAPEASSGSDSNRRSRDSGGSRFRRRDSSARRSSGSSSEGGIKMSEFEPEEPWSEEKLKRFYELDANGDGVITPAEMKRGG